MEMTRISVQLVLLCASRRPLWVQNQEIPTWFIGNIWFGCFPIRLSIVFIFIRVSFKLSGNTEDITVPQDKMLKMKDTVEAILKQVEREVVLVFDEIPDAHFSVLMRR